MYDMKKYKILFADLDGTLIDTISGETFPKGIWDMKFRFEVLDVIKRLSPEWLLIASNQGGIEKGFINGNSFEAKIQYVAVAIEDYTDGKTNVKWEFCPHNDKDFYTRKPNAGMLYKLIYAADWVNVFKFGKKIKYDKTEMLMIGDASGKPGQWSDTDRKTAEDFGIDYMDVEDFVNTYKTEWQLYTNRHQKKT